MQFKFYQYRTSKINTITCAFVLLKDDIFTGNKERSEGTVNFLLFLVLPKHSCSAGCVRRAREKTVQQSQTTHKTRMK